MSNIINYIINQLSAYLNKPIYLLKQQQVFGGDINQTFQLQTNVGNYFLKLNEDSFKDMFDKEFSGLQLLHQSNSIKIPEPLISGSFQNNIFLVTEFIEKGNQSKNFWQTFAQQLANLHKHSNKKFGLDTNNYIGSLHQQNNFCSTWSEFYATQRLLPLAQLAYQQNKFSKAEIVLTNKLCKRLHNLLPDEKPALLHGDLWSGNFISNSEGEPVIYDPAVYYGSREMDIAMTLLFGGFDKTFYDYYNEVLPLQPNWRERVSLSQLYPFMVHLILFGGNYYTSAINIIKQFI